MGPYQYSPDLILTQLIASQYRHWSGYEPLTALLHWANERTEASLRNQRRPDFVRFERDPKNGAGLWAVFIGDHPIHHFKPSQNVERYMANVRRNLQDYAVNGTEKNTENVAVTRAFVGERRSS